MENSFTIEPGALRGEVRMPSAKSELLRAVLLGAVAEGATRLEGVDLCSDAKAAIEAVAHCGVGVRHSQGGCVTIDGCRWHKADGLNAGESAFTLRTLPFLAGFQGLVGSIRGVGSLLGRPQRSLYATLDAVGMLYMAEGPGLNFSYLLPKRPYDFTLPPLESSQPLSGVLMAAPLLVEEVCVATQGVQSFGYVELTMRMMSQFGVTVHRRRPGVYVVPAGQRYVAGHARVWGDWSAASVLMAGAAYGGDLTLTNLERGSLQPDRAMAAALERAGVPCEWGAGGELRVDGRCKRPKSIIFDAKDCPDLAPSLVLLASRADGTSRIAGVHRLRGKESDRASALVEGFTKLGGRVCIEGDELVVEGVEVLRGGVEVTSYGDHRMAMVLGVAGALSERGVRVMGGGAVEKSYPAFWDDLRRLVG